MRSSAWPSHDSPCHGGTVSCTQEAVRYAYKQSSNSVNKHTLYIIVACWTAGILGHRHRLHQSGIDGIEVLSPPRCLNPLCFLKISVVLQSERPQRPVEQFDEAFDLSCIHQHCGKRLNCLIWPDSTECMSNFS